MKTAHMKTAQQINILCPLDFNENSLAALHLARRLTQEKGGTLHVLHVVPPTDSFVISAPLVAQRAYDSARTRLEEITREALSDVNYRSILKVGNPAEQIIETAAELRAYMIIMATHGRTGMSRFFLGSVAEKVVRESPCPVLTIREASVAESLRPETAVEARS